MKGKHMDLGTLTSKGQMTIPADIRRHFGLHNGDKLQFFIEDDRIVMVPAKGVVTDLKGIIPRPKNPVTVDDMNHAVAAEAAARMRAVP